MTDLKNRLRNFNIQIPLRAPRNRSPQEDKLLLKLLLCGAFYPHYFTCSKGDEADAVKVMSGKNPATNVVVSDKYWLCVQITRRSCYDPAAFKLMPALENLAHLLYNILITLLLWPPFFLVVPWSLLLIARCVGCHATRVCCTSSVSRRSSVRVTPVLRSKSRTPSEWTAG